MNDRNVKLIQEVRKGNINIINSVNKGNDNLIDTLNKGNDKLIKSKNKEVKEITEALSFKSEGSSSYNYSLNIKLKKSSTWSFS